MKVILSIKPEFAFKIFDGTKKYEYRRCIYKNKNIKKIIVYASAPVKQVIGEFEVDEILDYDIDTLWSLTKSPSGISEDYFYKYFSNKETGFAIKLKRTKKYKKPKCRKETCKISPPQSLAYYNHID